MVAMFDTLTTRDLYQLHNQMFEDHTRRYQACQEIPVFHPDYPARKAAMFELGETMSAICAEIKRREAEETADA